MRNQRDDATLSVYLDAISSVARAPPGTPDDAVAERQADAAERLVALHLSGLRGRFQIHCPPEVAVVLRLHAHHVVAGMVVCPPLRCLVGGCHLCGPCACAVSAGACAPLPHRMPAPADLSRWPLPCRTRRTCHTSVTAGLNDRLQHVQPGLVDAHGVKAHNHNAPRIFY